MTKKTKLLSLVMSVLMIFTALQGAVVSASVNVGQTNAAIEGINVKTNTCSNDIDLNIDNASVTVVEDGNETVHKYSATKTAKNIQQLYKVEGLKGNVHVASYDIKFDKIYLDDAKTSASVVAFRGYDDSGAGSGKDYNPNLEAVKATKNGDEVATLTTVAGDSLDYGIWYTFYMTVRIDGANRYSTLYYKERDKAEAVIFVNEMSDEYKRDGVLSYIYVYLMSTVFNAEKTSEICVDNISFRNQELILAQGSEVADVYNVDESINLDMYLAPGFKSAKVYVDEKASDIYSVNDGMYNLNVSLDGLTSGMHNFKVIATYGEDDSQNSIVYEKSFRIAEETVSVKLGNEMFADGVFSYGKDVTFIATPSGSESVTDGNSVNIKFSDASLSGTEYIKIPFYTKSTTYYNPASVNKPHAISFDMKLDGIVAKSAGSTDLMQIRGLKNGSWTGGTYKLTISEVDGMTVIKGLGSDYEIDQNKWYTFTFITNPANATYNVTCSEKGSESSTLIGTVSDPDTASINGIALGILKGNCAITTATDTVARVAPDVALDNLYIRQAVKIDGRAVSDKVYTTGEKLSVTSYIAPGFDSATITLGDAVAELTNNKACIYTSSKSLSDVEVPSTLKLKISATYGTDVVSVEENVNVVAATNYSIHKDINGSDMYYTLDNDETVDGAFPCMTIEKSAATFSLDSGKNNEGKSLKATYTLANEGAFCNFGYVAGTASAIENDRFTKISMDVKFSTREFKVKVQHKFNGSWPSPGASKEFINKYGIVQIEDKDTFYYDTNKWYNMSYVIDTVTNTGKVYLDGEYICTNTIGIGEIENPTQIQFCIAHKSATSENPAYLWVDNLKVETSPYCFYGIRGEKFASASKDVTALEIVPVSNPGSGITAYAKYSDGTQVGEMTIDAESGKATINANGAFNPYRDIILTLVDASNGKVLADQTYTFVSENGMIINDIEIMRASDLIKANVYACKGNEGSVATLILVSYKGTDMKEVVDIDVATIDITDERTKYTVSVAADSADEFAAFIWTGDKIIPLKKGIRFSK